MFEIDLEFSIQSETDSSNGLALMLLRNEPDEEEGYDLSKFNGIMAIVYKTVTRWPGSWVCIS
jgi:hypothetical protein